jgi:hypothetical protein
LANDKFYFDDDDKEITIPEGSYEMDTIGAYLKRIMLQKLGKNEEYNDDYPLSLRPNINTLKSEIKCASRINFSKPNIIGPMLRFSTARVLESEK